MGVALYLVLDNEDPGFDVATDGKAVGKASDKINAICASLGIPPIDDFVSMSMEEVADILDEEIPEVKEQWFTAEEGLVYFKKLAAHLKSHPAVIASSASVVEDIADYITVLEQATQVGARWRLSMDI
jgi:hypothetical protein